MTSLLPPLSVDALVIGGGPAGLSAALMLGRARRSVLVIDAGSPRNRFATAMHGVLGHDGVAPDELLRRGRAEIEGYGATVREGRVVTATAEEDALVLGLDDGSRVRARSVVLATGIADELPDVPGLAEHWGTRVLHCPYCHGWEVRDRRLGVLATGPMAVHQAELVRQWSDQVVFFTAAAGDALDAAARERLGTRGVRLIEQPVTAVQTTGPDAPLEVVTADGERVEVDAIFTAGRPRADDALLHALGVARSDDAAGGGVTIDMMGATSVPRVWAAGNVVAPMANIPIAMAGGAMAGSAVNAALVAEDARGALGRD